MHNVTSEAPDRRQLRQRLIAAREALSQEERQRRTELICGHLVGLVEQLQPSTLGFCWPFRAEPDLTDFVAKWLTGASYRHAALPVVEHADQPLVFRAWKPDSAMMTDRYGIASPIDGASVRPQVLLIPVNGFDEQGFRLGYGGGYFDRTLAAWQPAPTAVGIGFELARLPHIHPEQHDRPLDWVVTEAGIVDAAAIRRKARGLQ